MMHQRHRRTDDKQDRALHSSASRGKNTLKTPFKPMGENPQNLHLPLLDVDPI